MKECQTVACSLAVICCRVIPGSLHALCCDIRCYGYAFFLRRFQFCHAYYKDRFSGFVNTDISGMLLLVQLYNNSNNLYAFMLS